MAIKNDNIRSYRQDNKENSEKYDLILLDLKMPGMQGDEVLREIRRTDPYIYVVVYTNYTEYRDLKKLVNIGIDKYINKGIYMGHYLLDTNLFHI